MNAFIDAWTPVLTLRSTLVSLQSLLCSPEPKDPQDAEVAKHYISDRKGFEETARYWTEVYAKPDPSSSKSASSSSSGRGTDQKAIDDIKVNGLDPVHVNSFVNMGFSKDQVIDTLRRLNYRGANAAAVGEDQVVNALLGA